MSSVTTRRPSRAALRRRLHQLAPDIVFGTLAETYRRCGRAGCHCADGPKHGPHLSLSFRGPDGRTHAVYVPQALQAAVRAGVAAWHDVQQIVRALGDLHRRQLWASRAPRAGQSQRRSDDPSRVPAAKPRGSAAARRRQAVGRRTTGHRPDPRR
ncbi:MAG TPA: DUF6788 family protein [Methylomirabilota bacterium]|nr:DUF6788 family protein [Methylomirabilota bacterium]